MRLIRSKSRTHELTGGQGGVVRVVKALRKREKISKKKVRKTGARGDGASEDGADAKKKQKKNRQTRW